MDFSIRQKLGLLFVALICLSLLQGYVTFATIGTLGQTMDVSVKKASESSTLAGDIQARVSEMKAYAKMTQFAYALNGMMGQKTSACVSCHELPDSGKARRESAAIAAVVRPKLQALAALATSAEEKKLLERADRSVTEWTTAFDEFLAKASARGFDAGHSIITDRMGPMGERLTRETKDIEVAAENGLAQSQAETAAGVKRKAFLFVGVQLAVLAPTCLLGWRFILSLTARLKLLTVVARRLAAGDAAGASGLLDRGSAPS
jgi:CHASE3 domain sensor protein